MVDLIADFINEINNDENIGDNKNENVKSETRISYKQKIENSKIWDEYYLDVINSVHIVSWQLMNKLKSFSRSTIISRLQRLVDRKLIKRANNGLYHSLSYKSSRNDRHNLWIASIIMEHGKGYEFSRDIDISKDENSKFRFSRIMYDDNFVSDLIAIKNDNVFAYEVELHKKSNKKDMFSGETINQAKNKIEAYIRAIGNNQFTRVFYFTDNNSVKKHIEHCLRYFKYGGKQIRIIMKTDEEMMIK